MFCIFQCVILKTCFRQCQTNCQTAEVDEVCDRGNQNEVKCTEKRHEKHIDDTDTIRKEENVINHFDGASNLLDASKVIANNSETTEKSFPILENYPENTTLLHKGDNKDGMHLHLHPDLRSMGNDERYNLNVISSNGPTVQKEYLLEMASEVAHVLTEDTDHSELPSSFNLDLKCQKNQFLSSCLEEQKQLVNDLHIQVSRYVSMP